MKKLSFLAMALAAVVSYSCGEYDNAVDNGKTVFVDENNEKRPTDLDATLYGEAGATIKKLTVVVSNEKDTLVISTAGVEPIMKAADTNNSVTFENFTIGNDGIIKVYSSKGSDIISFYVDGNASPVSFDQPKFENIESITIKNANVEIVKLPALKKLTSFYLSDCIGLSRLEVAEATALEKLRVEYTVDSKLASVDLSNNKALTYVSFKQKNAEHKFGELTSIDLTNNLLLEEVNLAYNKIAFIKLNDSYDNLKTLTLTGNKLTEFNLVGSFPVLEGLYVNMNQELSSISVPELPSIKYLNVANDKLTFATVPLNATTYGNQADMEVVLNNNILDLTDQLIVDGTETTYTFGGLVEDEDYAVIEPGKFKFLKKLTGVVVTMKNARLPKLTLKTVAFDTAEPSDEVFSWSKDEVGEYIVGGTITSVPADDVAPYTHKIGYWQNVYATVVIDGTKESIAKPEYNYIRVDLDEPLKKGMKLSFTGFRYVLDEKNANLYLVFALPNYVNSKDYPDYIPGHFDYTQYQPTTYDWDSDIIFNNVFGTGLTPNKETRIVDETLEGVKSFKIARGQYAETPIYLTKIEITRK